MDSQRIFDEKKYVAWNYRIIREFRSKTQDEVVKDTGISKQNVSTWENLKGNPGQEFIDQLALYFDLPSNVFYMKPLTKEYLEKNFSGQNNTFVHKATDNKEISSPDPAEVMRQIVSGNGAYILINKELILQKYRLVSIEQYEEEKREAERKYEQMQIEANRKYEKEKLDHEVTLKELEYRKTQALGLVQALMEVARKIPNASGQVPEFEKAQ